MSAPPPSAPGNTAGGPASPIPPYLVRILIRVSPDAAASALAALRPSIRARLAEQVAAFEGSTPEAVTEAWGRLIATVRTTPPLSLRACDESICASVYEAQALLDLEIDRPHHAAMLIGMLTAPQRVAQATACAAWLSSWGFPVTMDDVLAGWSSIAQRSARPDERRQTG